jgi:hypothetical protein
LNEATPTVDVVAFTPETTTAPVVGDAVTPFVPVTEVTNIPPPPRRFFCIWLIIS